MPELSSHTSIFLVNIKVLYLLSHAYTLCSMFNVVRNGHNIASSPVPVWVCVLRFYGVSQLNLLFH